MNLITIAGDVVSGHVDNASADVTSAMVLRSRGQRPGRVVELLRRAQRELAAAELQILAEVREANLESVSVRRASQTSSNSKRRDA